MHSAQYYDKQDQKHLLQGNRNWKIYALTGQWTLYTNILMVPTKVVRSEILAIFENMGIFENLAIFENFGNFGNF